MILYFILLILPLVWCGLTLFEEDELLFNKPKRARTSMFSLKDAPFGSDPPTITIKYNFEGTSTNVTELWTYVVHSSVVSVIRREEEKTGTRTYCCTGDLLRAGECQRLGQPLINFTAVRDAGPLLAVELHRSPWTAEQLELDYTITESGFWSVYFVNCDPASSADDAITTGVGVGRVTGTIVWRNPFGLLPASQVGLMPTYIFLCIVHAFLVVVWWLLIYRAKGPDQVVRVQRWLGMVLVLMWFEQFIFALDWSIYNYDTGQINPIFNVLSALLAAMRSVACFVLLLLVAMGFTIYRPVLTKYWRQSVSCYAAASLVFSAVWNFVYMLSYTPQLDHLSLPEFAQLLISAPAVLMDFGFVVWIGLEMYRSIFLLKRHNQTMKLRLYKQLGLIMFLGTFIVVVMFMTEAVLSLTDSYEDLFHSWWLFDATYPCVLFVIVAAVCWLVRPGPGTEKLKQIEIRDDDDDNDDAAAAAAAAATPAIDLAQSPRHTVDAAAADQVDNETGSSDGSDGDDTKSVDLDDDTDEEEK